MITAKFIGKDRSMGFRKGNIYTLNITLKKNLIQIDDIKTDLFCYYSSIESFLANWRILNV